MIITQKELQDRIEGLASAITGLSTLANLSQSLWPQGAAFIMPHWLVQFCFIAALLGIAVRTMAASVASIVILFIPGDPGTTVLTSPDVTTTTKPEEKP